MADSYPDIEERFKKPDNFEFLTFATERGTTVRAGRIIHPQSWATVYILQGQREFIEGWYEIIRDLYVQGLSVCICERDGEGGSTRNAVNPQLPPSLLHDDHLKDMDKFFKEICPRRPDQPAILLTNSLGGLYGLNYVKKNPEYFDKAIFVVPPFGKDMKTKRDLSILFSAAVAAAGTALGLIDKDRYTPGASDWSWQKKSGRPPLTTHDTARYQNLLNWQLHHPELRMGGPTYGNLRALLKAMRSVQRRGFAENIQTPSMILSAKDDFMVSSKSHHTMAARMPDCKVITFEGARHNLMMESDQWRNEILETIAVAACMAQVSYWGVSLDTAPVRKISLPGSAPVVPSKAVPEPA